MKQLSCGVRAVATKDATSSAPVDVVYGSSGNSDCDSSSVLREPITPLVKESNATDCYRTTAKACADWLAGYM